MGRMHSRGSILGMFIFALVLMNVRVHATSNVTITILESAISKGAVCLDGTAPAYAYVEGSGNGSKSWIVYLKGGGWCYSFADCVTRSKSIKGSSRELLGSTDNTNFIGFLDSDCTLNPDFCNWHKVFIYYCDGSSFMSDVIDSTNLTFRGARIFKVMMEEMLSKGMRNAKDAILSGGSAGGLATMLHCDGFRSLFPSAARVKCISDSGFFVHEEGHYGDKRREQAYASIIKTHKLANSLPRACTLKRNSSLCLFPEYFVRDIKTPLFIIESAFDKNQIEYNVLPNKNLTRDNSTELRIVRDFASTFKNTLERVISNSSSRGMFVDSFYVHTHLLYPTQWTCIALANKSIRQTVADWYFDRSHVREIDIKNDSPQDLTNVSCPVSLNQKSLSISQKGGNECSGFSTECINTISVVLCDDPQKIITTFFSLECCTSVLTPNTCVNTLITKAINNCKLDKDRVDAQAKNILRNCDDTV